MKYFLIAIIIIVFGLVGYQKKREIIFQKTLIKNIRDYVNLYDSNIAIFKNDLAKINSEFIELQNKKSAKNCNFILKNNNLFKIDNIFLKKYLYNIDEINLIIDYLFGIGNSEIEIEKDKNKHMILMLEKIIKRLEQDENKKGNLFFKIMLAVGAVFAILVW